MSKADSVTLAFIGAGNMAGSIIGGLVQTGWPAEQIIAAEPSNTKLDVLAETLGIRTTNNNEDAVAAADIVVLAVKPQIMKSVVEPLAASFQEHKPLIVSVAAGIPENSLNQWAGGNMAIVRCMPNTPSLVQLGASGLYANALVSDEQKSVTEQIMDAVGISKWVESEAGIDDVIALAGSAPAYFFLMMEAMIEAGEKMGVSKEAASELVIQTALGAATMAKESDVDVAELKRRVMSPGGTTEQAIFSFEDSGIRTMVDKAMNACRNRAEEMADAFKD
ncbi:pyrroline-5-carboxylate reductase [Parendozoicomonas haliclonae]|uniref:Pyrroline-5-carboxylate reductase n=1 Tax=Parendozoicomonas haliclonae TaxID=1960125 RepID=A0A1X7AJW0_9GAMM|nr:pyrroline-5-carboxylate reductase [Parendozoicomonas haliclonae]SMA46162.1 Pyrroline-5-carboxylate reductase [Parendozoicomonas haliclonae]